jgi:hypothetical protein
LRERPIELEQQTPFRNRTGIGSWSWRLLAVMAVSGRIAESGKLVPIPLHHISHLCLELSKRRFFSVDLSKSLCHPSYCRNYQFSSNILFADQQKPSLLDQDAGIALSVHRCSRAHIGRRGGWMVGPDSPVHNNNSNGSLPSDTVQST